MKPEDLKQASAEIKGLVLNSKFWMWDSLDSLLLTKFVLPEEDAKRERELLDDHPGLVAKKFNLE